jgi:hypothetical protein
MAESRTTAGIWPTGRYRVSAAAHYTGLSKGEISRLCRTGDLKAEKFAGHWEISGESLIDLVRERGYVNA